MTITLFQFCCDAKFGKVFDVANGIIGIQLANSVCAIEPSGFSCAENTAIDFTFLKNRRKTMKIAEA